jgi:hypothetical protein
MTEKADTRLLWEGQSTLGKLRELVQARNNFELQLPQDYHFALFLHLYPDAPPGGPDLVDVSGTAELFKKVAEIRGLEQLADLVEPVTAAQAKVHIQSPAPGILVRFP